MTLRRLVLAAVLLLSGFNSSVRAESASAERDAPLVSTALSIWESTGNTSWNHDASAAQPLFGNPTSRLEYDSVDSTIVELRGRVELPGDIAVELAYGAGSADGGRLTDSDFASARGAEAFGTAGTGSNMYSQSVSILDGDAVQFFDARLAHEVYHARDNRTRVGMSARYLDWTEKYSARGVTQTTCTAPNRLCLPQGTVAFTDRQVISNDARWRALFAGLWGRHRLNDRFELSGELGYSPLADLSSDDQHFLRADLSKTPSFRHEGQGRAATAQVEASYHFSRRLTAALGARYWWMEVRSERRGFTAFPADDEPFSARLNSFESERYGVTFSITYRLGAVNLF